MNSRDAMYEEEVKAAIEASRKEMEPEAEVVEPEVVEEEAPKAKSKRKREEVLEPDPTPKIKHPNQYTYRPKVVPVPSPARRVTTPVPQVPAPALHEHGTRRAGALANGAREAPFIAVSVTHIGWNLPDYLSAFSDVFPTPNPTPLQVRSPRQLPPIPKNHFFNHTYGPFAEIDENGTLELPADPPEREATGKRGETHTEPPARVKYPQRRVTTAEMRKRVKHMQEFCNRVRVEEGRRSQRKAQISIPDAEAGDVDMEAHASTSTGPSASQLMAELTADLLDFQETWARGGFAHLDGSGPAWGGFSPIPPSSATFAQPGSGWPTSGLAKGVVGPDGDNDDGCEAEVEVPSAEGDVDEAESGPKDERGEEEGGTGENPAEGVTPHSATPMDPTLLADEPIMTEQTFHPLEVYREGMVAKVVATQAEVEAAEVIAGGMSGVGLGINGTGSMAPEPVGAT